MSAKIVLQQMMIIFILIMVGYIARRKGILPPGTSKGISALVVNVCNPAILVRSVFSIDESVTNEKLLLAALAAGVLYAILLAASWVLPRLLRVEAKWKNHYSLMCLFGNTGFIGIPLTAAVLGDQAVIYVAVVNTYFNLLFYTLGIRLADKENSRFSWKNFLNMGNLAIVVTLVLFFTRIKLPDVITSSVGYMADATTLLAMAVIGISLAETDLKEIFTEAKLYVFILVRFFAVPVLVSLILRRFVHDEVIYGVMVLMAAVPAGNMPLLRVEEKGGDGQILSKGIILSTLLSIASIPAVVALV